MTMFEAFLAGSLLNNQETWDASKKLHSIEPDLVNQPSHYRAGGLEAIDIIEAFAPRNVHRSHALKYLLRAGKKGGKAQGREDLEKALWWIKRELAQTEGEA